jgi:triphosphoribosyl-dephospho-CoA synthase
MSPLADQIHTACLLEATAAKPGNVHPRQSFADMNYSDLVRSADAVSEILARARQQGVGPTILEATRATAEVVSCNTNLGIILLLAPLAAVPTHESLDEGIGGVLLRLDHQDTSCVYQAIRLASPGGLGDSDQHDVRDSPSVSLSEAMRVAADRDGVAAAYHDRFRGVLDWSRRGLAGGESFAGDWETQVIGLALSIQAEQPDTLIARKCGQAIAQEASERAQAVLGAGWPHHPDAAAALSSFDSWLRDDGHRRNPGTTADWVTAALFAALRENRIVAPNRDSLERP